MDDKKFESPEEVRAFLDSDAFADGFKRWSAASKALFTEVDQRLQPLAMKLQRLKEAAAPIVREFVEWNVSCEVLGRAGWLPHYTTPFDYIAKYGEDIEAVRSRLLDYYKDNWQNVRSEIESRLPDYKIDAEAKATFREALDAHEAGLYRCVCRVLFPEIERVFRAELFNNKIGLISYKKFIKALLDNHESIDDFISAGLYDLSNFRHLTKAFQEKEGKQKGEKEKNTSESDKLIFGLFNDALSEEHRESLKQSPIPNRHATIHGLVIYSSPQNSLNTIFIADYVFRIVAPATSLPTLRQ